MKRLMILLVAGAVSAAARGQTARQGDPQVIEPTVFHSPMVIETIFAPADRDLWMDDDWRPDKPKPWKSGHFTTVEYFDLGKYTCDGLSIRNGSRRGGSWNSGLVMSLRYKGDKVHVWLEVHVTNPGHVHDKFVTLLLEVVNGDAVVGKTTVRLKVKQNWHTDEEVKGEEDEIVLAADSLKENPVTKLRITMTTQDY